MDLVQRVRAALLLDPNVTSVDIVGSRSVGTETALSDWDFRIEALDHDELVTALPSLTEQLSPLAAQWDRLSERAVYMLVLPGAIKVDLFPGERRRARDAPWQPQPDNLSAIDAHFWDWILWLGGKALRGQIGIVDEELDKLHVNVLGPLGANTVPRSITNAIDQYQQLRETAERTGHVIVDRRLGDDVLARLRHERVA